MKHIYVGTIIIFLSSLASASDLSGNWDCVMTSDQGPEEFHVKSSINIDLASGTFEREGDIKFEFKEFGGFTVHKKTYEKGSARVEGDILHVSPMTVSSEIIESGPIPKSTFENSDNELLRDGRSQIVSISSDSYVLKNESGSIDSCTRKK